MDTKMDTKKVSWDLLVFRLKNETGTEEKAALKEWLSTGTNSDFYNEIVTFRYSVCIYLDPEMSNR